MDYDKTILRADCAACVLGPVCGHALNTRQHPWNTWEEGKQWKLEQEKAEQKNNQKQEREQ